MSKRAQMSPAEVLEWLREEQRKPYGLSAILLLTKPGFWGSKVYRLGGAITKINDDGTFEGKLG